MTIAVKLEDIVRSHMKDKNTLHEAPAIARIDGPSEVIELIIQMASSYSGIPMDWEYVGGRGVVRSYGDKEKCRNALRLQVPDTDLKGE